MIRLEMLRIGRRMTKAELARRTFFERRTITRIERGETKTPYRGTLEKLSEALGWTGDPQGLMDEMGEHCPCCGRPLVD